MRTGKDMTRTDDFELSLKLDLETLMAAYGPRRVLLGTLAALLTHHRNRGLAARFSEMDDHLRRDIGLPPRGPSPPMPHWTHFGF